MKSEKISANLVARLPAYYRCVDDLYHCNCIRVSSTTLSGILGFTAAQIRQDLSRFGEFGQQGYGYNVKKLRYEIQEILGLNERNTCILVGCGNLGQALLNNFDFDACGFQVLGAFDQRENLIGTTVGSFVIENAEKLRDFVAKEQPVMAVLTVSRQSAQQVAELLAEAGITAIWNFTHATLDMRKHDVVVEQISFADSLLKLSYRLAERHRED